MGVMVVRKLQGSHMREELKYGIQVNKMEENKFNKNILVSIVLKRK